MCFEAFSELWTYRCISWARRSSSAQFFLQCINIDVEVFTKHLQELQKFSERNPSAGPEIKLQFLQFLIFDTKISFLKKINPYRKLHQKVGRAEMMPK